MSNFYRDKTLTADPTLQDNYVGRYISTTFGNEKTDPYFDDGDNIFVDAAQVIGITAASAVTSLFNGVTGLGNVVSNWAGNGNLIDPIETTSLIPDSWADDYIRSKESYDIAGDVVGSILPGTLAVKFARGVSRGAVGIARFFDDTYYMSKQSRAYREVIQSVKVTDTWNKAAYINKTLKIGAQRAAVEGAVFELASYAAINAHTDLAREDINAFDILGHVGERVLYGATFGAVLGGLGNYVSRASNITKRLKEKKYSSDLGSEALLGSAPKGSQVVQHKNNIDTLTRELGESPALREHISSQNTKMDDVLASMMEKGTTNPMFSDISRYVKDTDVEHVEGMLTGAENFTQMRSSYGDPVPKEMPLYMRDFLQTFAPGETVGAGVHKIQEMVKANPKFVKEHPDAAFFLLDSVEEYLPNIMYYNLKNGTRAMELTHPSLGDYGITKFHTRGGSYKNSYLQLANGRLIRWGESLEADRALAKKMFLEDVSHEFPDIKSVDDNLALSEALYIAKAQAHPTAQAAGTPFPKGIKSLDELGDAIYEAKLSKYHDMIQKGESMEQITQKLGITDPEDLLSNNLEVWINLDKLTLEREWVRMKMNPLTYNLNTELAVLSDKMHYSQLEDYANQVAYEVTGINADNFPHLIDGVVAEAVDTGATLLKPAPSAGNYFSATHIFTNIGQLLHSVTRAKYTEIRDSLQQTFLSMGADPKAVVDFVHARTWLEGRSKQVYLLDTDDGRVWLAEDKIAEHIATEGSLPPEAIAGENVIELVEDNAKAWAKAWDKYTRTIAIDKFKTLSAEGKKPTFDVSAFYLPPTS